MIQAKPLFIIAGVMGLITLGYISYVQVVNPSLLFFCVSDSGTRICEHTNNNDETKVAPALDDAINWSPVKGYGGYLYFTSDRDGKAEIYYLDKNGDAVRVTQTDNPY